MPSKERYQKHKEYYKQYNKEYKKNNQEHIKVYNQTDICKKTMIISNWKRSSLICDNYEELYKHYINTWECDNCGVELVSGNYGANRRCMDHCHITCKFRNILCHTCNIQRGLDDRSNLIGL